ncbi:hypothetical protein LCGC14_0947980, partial [marine sediment metagenome]
ADYRGEVGVLLINHGTTTFKVCKGDRIAQAILAKAILVNYRQVKELSNTDRGAGGFGSTGRS